MEDVSRRKCMNIALQALLPLSTLIHFRVLQGGGHMPVIMSLDPSPPSPPSTPSHLLASHLLASHSLPLHTFSRYIRAGTSSAPLAATVSSAGYPQSARFAARRSRSPRYLLYGCMQKV